MMLTANLSLDPSARNFDTGAHAVIAPVGGALLAEDSTPLLAEDGTPLESE